MIPEQTAPVRKLNVHARQLPWVVLSLSVGFVAGGSLLLALNFPTTGGSAYFFNNLVAALVLATLGTLIAVRQWESPLGWLFVASGFLYAVVMFMVEYGAYVLVTRPGAWPGGAFAAWLASWLWIPAGLLVLFLFLYFPDGRLPSPRWRPVAILAAMDIGWATLAYALRPGPLESIPLLVENPFGVTNLATFLEPTSSLTTLLGGALVLAPLVALVVRFRRATGEERQQIKWVAYAAAMLTVAIVVVNLWPDLQPSRAGRALFLISYLTLPVVMGVAIFKYRLYDIDPIINRTLVYGALTACVVGLYVLIVGYLGTAFNTRSNLAISLVATGVVAVLFQPLRERIQRAVNRLMYGERDDPYAVLTRLGQRLKGALAPERVLPEIVEMVAQALKLPYVAIAVQEGEEERVVAASGFPTNGVVSLPLVYQSQVVGQLLVEQRVPAESLTPADLRLLEDIADQTGVAVHAVRLTDDLQRSRERLVTTREEERRRLRRDLHDGLGPTLAALALEAATVSDLVHTNPEAAKALADDLYAQIRGTVGEVRRLVYELRPPTLDELGLAGAIREQAARFNQQAQQNAPAREEADDPSGDPSRLSIAVEAPHAFPPLPAAVEVAAFHIVREALTNVVHHAVARHCLVRLSLDGSLRVEVLDDGIGVPPQHRVGVGLLSMRERATELGGSCVIEARARGGTRVSASLPLSKE